jgi:hypothetical protein
MMMPMERDLPFKTDEAYHGFAEIQGLLHVERDHLLLEFEMKDSILGVIKSGAKELEISYFDLNKVEYKRSLFKSRLILSVNNMRVLSAFPGAKDGVIALKIKRRYKGEAEDIESYVNLRIAELKLEQLEREG